MVKTYSQLYLETRKKLLATEDPQTAGYMARQLLCHLSGKSQEQVVADMELYASEELADKMDFAVSRILNEEPLAYILGEW